MANLRKSKKSRIRSFLDDESGPSTVEYAVVLALIMAAAILSVNAVGTSASKVFKDTGKALKGSKGGMGGMGM